MHNKARGKRPTYRRMTVSALLSVLRHDARIYCWELMLPLIGPLNILIPWSGCVWTIKCHRQNRAVRFVLILTPMSSCDSARLIVVSHCWCMATSWTILWWCITGEWQDFLRKLKSEYYHEHRPFIFNTANYVLGLVMAFWGIHFQSIGTVFWE